MDSHTDEVVRYLGYIIQANAIQFEGKWYPILRILNHNYREIHRRQVPAVEGVTDAKTATTLAILFAQEMIDREQS